MRFRFFLTRFPTKYLFSMGAPSRCSEVSIGIRGMNNIDKKSDTLFSQFLFNRKLLLFFHILLIVFSAIIYVSNLQLSGFQYWRRLGAINALVVAAPSIIPLVMSAIYSWRVVTYRRFRTYLFMFIITAGTVSACLLYLGFFNVKLDAEDVFFVTAFQIVAYVWTSELLLNVE